MDGRTGSVEAFLLASVLDSINALIWSLGGGKKSDKPKSAAKLFAESKEKTESNIYSSPEAFEQARERLLGKENG